MITKSLKENIQDVLTDTSHDGLMEHLKNMSMMFNELQDAFMVFFVERTNTNAEKVPLAKVSEISDLLKRISPREIFLQLDSFNLLVKKLPFENLANYFTSINEDVDIAEMVERSLGRSPDFPPIITDVFANHLDEFAAAYEKEILSPNVQSLFKTLKEADAIYKGFLLMRVSLRDALALLVEDDPPVSYSEESLEITLHRSYTLEELTNKLSALVGMYSELCRLFSVSTAEFPLKVIKVESGSLWLKLFGESKIIGLMTKSLEAVAGYYYRTFVTEGKLGSIPAQIEGVEAVLNLSERLKASGIDTSEMNEDIKKSATLIAKHQAKLLAGEFEVEINDTEFSAVSSFDQMISEASDRPLLMGEDHKLLGEGDPDEED